MRAGSRASPAAGAGAFRSELRSAGGKQGVTTRKCPVRRTVAIAAPSCESSVCVSAIAAFWPLDRRCTKPDPAASKWPGFAPPSTTNRSVLVQAAVNRRRCDPSIGVGVPSGGRTLPTTCGWNPGADGRSSPALKHRRLLLSPLCSEAESLFSASSSPTLCPTR